MKKVLITDLVDESCIDIFNSAGYEVEYSTKLTNEKLLEKIRGFDALVVRSSTQVTADVINNAGKIQVIGRAGAGVDNIDIPTATRKGILVMNTPGGNTISAAEHTIALMLSACRRIPQANISMREHKWDRKSFQGMELAGKTLGIIGLGKIGREVAARAKAFGMSLLAFDPVVSGDSYKELGINLVDLEEIWKNSDIITVHSPLNDKTKHLVSNIEFAKCKKGVVILNCARGGIINETDLLNALNKKIVAAAGLDVYETEPPDFSNELFSHPSVICTPHLGASTEEAQKKVAVQIAGQIINYFEKGSLEGAVNTLVLKENISELQKPYLKLSETLGKILSQVRKETLKKININFNGDLFKYSTGLFSTALMKGFLSEELEEPVNMINTPVLINEMRIQIDETISTVHTDYYNLIIATLETDNESWQFSGTVFGSNDLRIVNINQYPVEFKPEGNILIYRNIDKPGMLASVSKIFSTANINIASVALGRIEEGKYAITVMTLDSKTSDEMRKSILLLEGIMDVYSLHI